MDQTEAKKLLAEARDRIRAELERIESGVGQGDTLAVQGQHPADVGTELFEREKDDSVALSLREELAAIDRAFQRIKEGTYGISIESGEPIPDPRLAVQPWAERTVAEQAAYEATRLHSRPDRTA